MERHDLISLRQDSACGDFVSRLPAAILIALFLFLTQSRSVPAQGGTISLSVRVTDAGNEGVLDRAKVELLRFPSGLLQQAFTDSSGRVEFLISNPERSNQFPQQYILRAFLDGYRMGEISVSISPGESAKFASIQLERTQAAKMEPTGHLVSARTLSIPKPAREEFDKGLHFLNAQKNPKASLDHFQRAVRLAPDFYEAYFLLGMAYVELNSGSEAEAALRKSIQINRQFLPPYYPLAVLLISQKQFEEGERLLLQAMEQDKQGWKWPFELARCYATRGQWDKALAYGEIAYERPNSPSKVHLLMADLYSNTGKRDKAIEELEIFAKLDPNSSYMPRVQQALRQLRKP